MVQGKNRSALMAVVALMMALLMTTPCEGVNHAVQIGHFMKTGDSTLMVTGTLDPVVENTISNLTVIVKGLCSLEKNMAPNELSQTLRFVDRVLHAIAKIDSEMFADPVINDMSKTIRGLVDAPEYSSLVESFSQSYLQFGDGLIQKIIDNGVSQKSFEQLSSKLSGSSSVKAIQPNEARTMNPYMDDVAFVELRESCSEGSFTMGKCTFTCTEGQYAAQCLTKLGGASNAVCKTCPAGYFDPAVGSVCDYCQGCPTNFYQSLSGQTECVRCNSTYGAHSSTNGLQSQEECFCNSGYEMVNGVCTEIPSPTPSTSMSPSESPSISHSPSQSPSESASPSMSPSVSYSPSESHSLSPTISETRSPSLTPSETRSPSPSPSESSPPSETKSVSISPSPSVSPSMSPSESASSTISMSPSQTPSTTTTSTASASPTSTASASFSASASSAPSSTPSASPSPSFVKSTESDWDKFGKWIVLAVGILVVLIVIGALVYKFVIQPRNRVHPEPDFYSIVPPDGSGHKTGAKGGHRQ